MLRMRSQSPVPEYSEGSWGLSVLLRVTIRAGRNLPDKEFRYLRTVIVTADIHGGFGSELRLAADPSP